jgi:hypothetical protein
MSMSHAEGLLSAEYGGWYATMDTYTFSTPSGTASSTVLSEPTFQFSKDGLKSAMLKNFFLPAATASVGAGLTRVSCLRTLSSCLPASAGAAAGAVAKAGAAITFGHGARHLAGTGSVPFHYLGG